MYNIRYMDEYYQWHVYLLMPVDTQEQANYWLERFTNQYVGQPFPNGAGMYPYHSPEIVKVR